MLEASVGELAWALAEELGLSEAETRLARIDLSRLRVAATPDFGFAPTERVIAKLCSYPGAFRSSKKMPPIPRGSLRCLRKK